MSKIIKKGFTSCDKSVRRIRSQFHAWVYEALLRIENYLPLSDSIVLECESDMDDNPRAFFEYLIANGYNKKNKIIWIVNDPALCNELYGATNVLFFNRKNTAAKNQLIMNYYLRTAKILIFSHPWWYKKVNKKQLIINTGHGIPIKGKPQKSIIADTFDYGSANSELTIKWYSEFCNCPETKFKVTGIPRNDCLYSGEKVAIFKKLFEYKEGEKIIICMPTYRQSAQQKDSDNVDKYSISVVQSDQDLNNLNNILRINNTHLVIKPHPLQRTDLLITNDLSNIHYINNRSLLEKKIIFYELLGCTDALITDFSSVYFDYLLVGKPIGLLENDVDTYSRGYLLEDHEKYMVGVKIKQYSDLVSFIVSSAHGEDKYILQRRQLNDLVNDGAKTENCKRFSDFLIALQKQKNYPVS